MPQPRRRSPSPRQRGIPRKRTIAAKRLTREFLRVEWLKLPRDAVTEEQELEAMRPKTREECRGESNRPCPWVACKHHLYLDVNPETGSITINFPDLEPWEIPSTCSLDVAERGGITLEEVGEKLNITRERVRQIEVRALVIKAKPIAKHLGLDEIELGQHLTTPLAEIAEEGTVEAAPSGVTFHNG